MADADKTFRLYEGAGHGLLHGESVDFCASVRADIRAWMEARLRGSIEGPSAGDPRP